MLTITATGRYSKCVSNEVITAGSVGIPAVFNLNEDFDGLSPIAVFRGSGVSIDVALISNEATVPHEVLANVGGLLEVGVYARNGEGTIIIPTVWSVAGSIREGAIASGVDPSEPTPDWTAQVQMAATEAVNTANAAKDIAEDAKEAAITSADSAKNSASAAASSAEEAAESAYAAGITYENVERLHDSTYSYMQTTEEYAVWTGQKASEAAESAETASDSASSASASATIATKNANDAIASSQSASESAATAIEAANTAINSANRASEAEINAAESARLAGISEVTSGINAITAETAKTAAVTAKEEAEEAKTVTVAAKEAAVSANASVQESVTYISEAEQTAVAAAETASAAKTDAEAARDEVQETAESIAESVAEKMPIVTFDDPVVAVNTTTISFTPDADDPTIYTSAPNAIRFTPQPYRLYKIEWDGTEYEALYYQSVYPTESLTGTYACFMIGNAEIVGRDNPYPTDAPFLLARRFKRTETNAMRVLTASTAASHTIKVTAVPYTVTVVSKAYYEQLDESGRPAITSGGGVASAMFNAAGKAGHYATALGEGTEATGTAAVASGFSSKATASASHAEGVSTLASQGGAHAEGALTEAAGYYSHAEGFKSVASGMAAHAEGGATIANHRAQVAFGMYNEADPSTAAATANGTYIEIVGNGKSDESRSNARTLDWDGNERLAGDLTLHAGGVGETTVGEALTDTQSMLATVEVSDAASKDYAVGDLLVYDGRLCRVVSAISLGDTLILDGNIEATTVEQEMANAGSGVRDVQVDGTSVVQNGIADIKISYGLQVTSNGAILLDPANIITIKDGNVAYSAVPVCYQNYATFYGLAKAAGYDEKDSTLPVGQYTDEAKSAIHEMLNGSVSVSGATPIIAAKSGISYVCGEVSTLTITLPASGIFDVRFTSGATPTVLTANGVIWPDWFDHTDLESDTVYELNIRDGYGVVATWAV